MPTKPRRIKITREKGVELKPKKKWPRKKTTKRLA